MRGVNFLWLPEGGGQGGRGGRGESLLGMGGQSLLWRGKFLKGVQSGHMLTVWNSSEKSVIVTFIVPLGKYIMYNHQCSSVALSRK